MSLSFLNQDLYSQIVEPVKWKYSSKKIGESTYELTFTATIDSSWHIYSQHIKEQPPASLFTFEKNEKIQLLGDVLELSDCIDAFDEHIAMQVKYFEKEAIFLQEVKVLTKAKAKLKGYFEYMCCNDTGCLPPTKKEFEFVFNDLKKQPQSNILQKNLKN